MHFITFNGLLWLSSLVAVFIFSIGLMILYALITSFTKSDNIPKSILYPFMVIVGAYQIYFWGFWSAFCVAITIKFIHNPDVSYNWLYWIAGFISCLSLLGWLEAKSKLGSQSVEESRRIEEGSKFYILITIVAFLLFSFAPSYSILPYGYLLNPLGLKKYVASQNTPQSYSSIDNKIIWDKDVEKSVSAFFTGYQYFLSANKLGSNITNSKDPFGDFEKVQTLMKKSKERLEECDARLLNKLYNRWGDMISNKFIPSIDYFLSGVQPGGDRNDLARSDALAAEFDDWLRNNWDNIAVMLNDKFNIKIN